MKNISIKELVNILKTYMIEKNSDREIFNILFMPFDDLEIVKRKRGSYGIDKTTISQIMNGNAQIPRNYINAAKKADINDLAEYYERDLAQYISPDDKKRIEKDVINAFIEDNYYTTEEKRDVTDALVENDFALFFAHVFVKILIRNCEVNDNSNIGIKCFYDNDILNDIYCTDMTKDRVSIIGDIKDIINNMIDKIDSTILINVENNNTNQFLNNELITSLDKIANVFDKYKTKVEIDYEDKQIIDNYLNTENITVNKSFYYLGKLERMNLGSLMGTSLEGSDEEKEKYNDFINLIRYINNLNELKRFFLVTKFNYALKLLFVNDVIEDDSNILITLLFPKDSLSYYEEYYFSEHICSDYFNTIFNKYLETKETADIEICNYRNTFNIRTYIPSSNVGEQKDINNANYNYSTLLPYTFIDDKDYDVLKFEINDVRCNSINLFPATILLSSEPKIIKYKIKSNNIKGEVVGEIKRK